MTSMRSVLSWGAVVAVGGVLIAWLLGEGSPAGLWLFAAVLAGHGAVHLLFVVPAPEGTPSPWAFDMSRSWISARLGSGVDASRAVGSGLIALAVVGFILAGLSTVGLIVPSGWWPPIVAASALVSSGLLALYFNGQLVVGLGINALLIWVVLAGLWVP